MAEGLFENLEYGAYMLAYDSGYYSENFKYASAEFNKLYFRRIRLPDGRGNIVYLMSDSFENSIRMLNRGDFVMPPTYKKAFCPVWYLGRFLNKRVSVNTRKLQQDRRKIISSQTKLIPYTSRNLLPTMDNVIFFTSDLVESMTNVMKLTPIKRNYLEFYPGYVSALKSMTPAPKKESNDPNFNNRLILIDCNAFKFDRSAKLDDNKTNPLFLLYLAYLRTRDLSQLNVDIDMLICNKNLFMKFNPKMLNNANLWSTFRKALFRMMDTDLDEYTSTLSEEDKKQIEDTSSDKLVASIVNDAVKPYTKNVSPSTKAVLADAVERQFAKQVGNVAKVDKIIKDTQAAVSRSLPATSLKDDKPVSDKEFFKSTLGGTNHSLIHTNPVVTPLTDKQEKLFASIGKEYVPLATKSGVMIDDDYDDERPEDLDERDVSEEDEDDIKRDVLDILTTDEDVASDVIDEIQDKVAPLKNLKTAPVNSARDQKLREEQKKKVVKDSTIGEILARDASNVPVKTTNKSNVMHTSNPNVKNITFANFDKTYLDELYVKDIVSCFDSLKDKDSPFYITGIEVKDSSDSLNYKETWTVHLVDEHGKKHKPIKVDIPKFQNDRFMFIEGTRWIILKQNFYNPLVKDTPDTVILTTNYNKVTIDRVSTRSLNIIERIFSLMKKTGDSKMFVTGNSSSGNMKYISTLEYDELSRSLFKFETDTCVLYFSRDYIKENVKVPSGIKGDEFFIGMEKGSPIFINEDSGLDRSGRTIAEIIENNLPDEYKKIFGSIKGPTQVMYAEGKLAGEFIPVVTTLIVWIGLTKTLDRMEIQWRFDPNMKHVPMASGSKKYIRFADGVLEYESKIFAELILNGLTKMHPEKFKFSDFDTELAYDDFIYAQWGSYNGINELKNFYEFLIDPITKDVCKDLMLPDDAPGLLIRAVQLLADNKYVSKASDQSYRVRSIEEIPGILYKCIANQYKMYAKSGGRIPMTLKQNCVIRELIALKTVEAYSTLNPVIEVSKTHSISTKGYCGSNSEHSYDEPKRSYDPTSVGKLALSTSADSNVGINKNLVVEPTIANARGYRKQVEDISELKDVNIFSPVEMLTPGTARNDDPIRTAIATKQSQHIVPVEDASPALVSNGYDEAVQFHLSDDFVINAEEDGKVIDVNDDLGFVMVEYKSGKTRAIYTKPEIVKNSGGGFYMSNQLKPVHAKVGETFKKDEPLAYHPKYFQYSKTNGLRFSIGPIVKMAIMSSYNTYEDAGICTEELAERMATSIVYHTIARFKRNVNIISMVKIGDHVNIGDSLVKFDVSVEDTELAKYLSKLSEENAEVLKEETKDDIKADHAGTVIDIKVYSLLEPAGLSPSLGKIVQQYFDKGIDKKEYLSKFDASEGTMKAGYLLTDSTEPVKNRYNTIKGDKGTDVRIEIYVEHKDVMGVGDKVAQYNANKQIISQVIPKGWEPYSEFRPDEVISSISSPGTIARRMTPGVIPIMSAAKVLVELKRKIKEEIKYT